MSGPQGIQVQEMRAYFDEVELEGDHRKRCFRFVQALDVAYLNHCYEKLKTREKPKPERAK